MLGIVFIGIAITLTGFAIFAKTYSGKPKKALKSEKAEIMKQLLALSEGEKKSSPLTSPPAKDAPPSSSSRICGETSRTGTSRGRTSKRRYTGRAELPHSARQSDGQIEERIRQRAYELYQERGGVNGSPTEDWLQAKHEVLSRKAKAGKGSS